MGGGKGKGLEMGDEGQKKKKIPVISPKDMAPWQI